MPEFNQQELGAFGDPSFNEEELGLLSPMEGKQTLEILIESAKREQPDLDVPKFVSDMVTSVVANELFLLRIINTVFVLRPLGGTSLEFHTATIEDPNTLMERFDAAAKALKNLGCTHVVSYSSDAKYIRLVKLMAMRGDLINPTVTQIEAEGPNPVYQFEAEL